MLDPKREIFFAGCNQTCVWFELHHRSREVSREQVAIYGNCGIRRGNARVTPLIERSDGMRLLLQAAEDARRGAGVVVFVSGEVGIGKSRLISDLFARLPQDCLRAGSSCDNLTIVRRFGPLFDLSENLGKNFALELAAAIDGPDPIGSAGQALLRLPPGSVLAVDDLHNADDETLDLLKYLVRRIRASGLMLVGAYRPEDAPLDHPLTGLFAECPAECSLQFELPPFSRNETADICAGYSSSVEEIYRLTGGNPLLVTELARKEFKDGEKLPEAIRRLAAARLQRLSATQRAWIELLAVVPAPHGQGLIAALADDFDLDPGEIPIDSGFLSPGLKGEFRQIALRLAVLSQASQFGLAELRRRLLVLLQSAGTNVANAECLFRLGLEAEDPSTVAGWAIPAARLAEARGDLYDCVGHLTKALPFAQTVDATLHAQISELWACRTAVHEGIGQRTIDLIARNLAYWRRQHEPMAVGMCCLLLGRLLYYRADPIAARQSIEQAIASFERSEPCTELVSAYVLAAELDLANSDVTAAAHQIKSAEEAVRQVKDKAGQLELMLAQAQLLVAQGRAAQAWRRFEVAFSGASKLALHELAARIQIAACDSARGELDLALAEDWLSRSSALRESPLPNCWKTALNGRLALIAVRRGEHELAASLARSSLEGIAAPPLFAFPARLADAVSAARHAVPGAEAQLTELSEVASQIGNLNLEDTVRLFRIEMLVLADRKDEARILWHQLHDRSATSFIRGSRVLWARRLNIDLPEDLADLPGPIALELAGDIAGAAQEWRAAGYSYQGMLAWLWTQGDAIEEALRDARQASDAMGTSAATEAILRLATQRGIALSDKSRKRGPYRASRNHPLGLTGREVDILRMIVDGVSNREIAQRLNRSLRTIEHHVSAILGKMGIENRVQAALYAVAHPEIIDR